MVKLRAFIKTLFSSYSKDNIPRLSAALAYYTIFSLAPILLICIALIGFFFGSEAAKGQILDRIGGYVGHDIGLQIQTMIESADKPNHAFISKLFGIVMLLFGATGVFSEIQSGLNKIWEVKVNPEISWILIIKDKFLSFAMVLGIAFLLLVSFVLTLVLTTIGFYITNYLGVDSIDMILTHGISFLIVVLLFAMIFKLLPDAIIQWREVWLGAFITALLFTVGKFLLGIYLNKANISSAFGAAGSLAVLLVWVYYASQIFFIGAEITKVFSTQKREIVPKPKAVTRSH